MPVLGWHNPVLDCLLKIRRLGPAWQAPEPESSPARRGAEALRI